MMSANTGVLQYDTLFKRIRLLRKKLKQIETLKLLPRKLNSEEETKIRKQDVFRDELLDLLTEQEKLISTRPVTNAHEELLEQCEEDSLDESINSDQKAADQNESDTARSDEPAVNKQSTDFDTSSEQRGGDTPAEIPVAKSHHPQVTPALADTDQLKVKRKSWANRYFDLLALEGHTDIIRSVDVSSQYIISGSRDTSLKVWDRASGELLQNLGGHQGQVNCVKFIKDNAGVTKGRSKVVSGSEDCTIRLWDTTSGVQLKEVYVYNSVTCLELVSTGEYLAAGLDGGKLEIYSSQDLTHLCSHSLQADRLVCLSAQDSLLAVGGSDGLVTVLEWTDSSFRCLYTLEDEPVSGVKSITLDQDQVIVGDEGANIKVVHWRQNRVTALANHTSEFGVTDALCASGDYLLSSAYDYDSGTGYLNVRDSSQHKYDYLSSISDSDVMHILAVAACGGNGSVPLTIVTGGTQLVIWEENHTRSVDSVKSKARRMVLANDHLDSESDDYDGDSEVTDDSECTDSENPGLDDHEEDGWWCTLL